MWRGAECSRFRAVVVSSWKSRPGTGSSRPPGGECSATPSRGAVPDPCPGSSARTPTTSAGYRCVTSTSPLASRGEVGPLALGVPGQRAALWDRRPLAAQPPGAPILNCGFVRCQLFGRAEQAGGAAGSARLDRGRRRVAQCPAQAPPNPVATPAFAPYSHRMDSEDENPRLRRSLKSA
jgi:hypothetical protein